LEKERAASKESECTACNREHHPEREKDHGGLVRVARPHGESQACDAQRNDTEGCVRRNKEDYPTCSKEADSPDKESGAQTQVLVNPCSDGLHVSPN
jgi:hypothetical protein